MIARTPVWHCVDGALRALRLSVTTVIVPVAFVTLDSAGTAHAPPAGAGVDRADFATHREVDPLVTRAHEP